MLAKTGSMRHVKSPHPPVFCVSVGSIGLTGESPGCVGMISTVLTLHLNGKRLASDLESAGIKASATWKQLSPAPMARLKPRPDEWGRRLWNLARLEGEHP